MRPQTAKFTFARLKVTPQHTKANSRAALRKPQGPDPLTDSSPSSQVSKLPTILVLSNDASLRQLISDICPSSWQVESRPEPGPGRDLVLERNVRMVVVDDEVVSVAERGWFFNQINRLAPRAAKIYIASQHSAEVEKTARAHGALYYTSKPIDTGRLSRMVQAWLKHPWP